MKKFVCDRCGSKIGMSDEEEEGSEFYDVRRSSDWSRFGHKGERYICTACMKNDPRYKKENDVSFSKKAGS